MLELILWDELVEEVVSGLNMVDCWALKVMRYWMFFDSKILLQHFTSYQLPVSGVQLSFPWLTVASAWLSQDWL